MKGVKAMRLFVGTLDEYKLDTKGRLSVPVKWRERLGSEFYIVRLQIKGCSFLSLYPVDAFNALYERMSYGTENQKYDVLTSFFSMAEEAKLDAQGRFTVNQRLKELGHLEDNNPILFIGHGETIEIWNVDEREKFMQTTDSTQGLLDLMDKADKSNNGI
ncbi:MAG: hypothetical protein LUH82_00920 [Clostridiales bacterium]|nr:hypothetical protein [Clostridiales bacterium]